MLLANIAGAMRGDTRAIDRLGRGCMTDDGVEQASAFDLNAPSSSISGASPIGSGGIAVDAADAERRSVFALAGSASRKADARIARNMISELCNNTTLERWGL